MKIGIKKVFEINGLLNKVDIEWATLIKLIKDLEVSLKVDLGIFLVEFKDTAGQLKFTTYNEILDYKVKYVEKTTKSLVEK